MTVEAITTESLLSFIEPDPKARQIWGIYELALFGQMGLSFLLLKIPDRETPKRIQKALGFLDVVEGDLNRGEELVFGTKTEGGIILELDPKLYRPSEVLPKNIPDIPQAIKTVRTTMERLLDPLTQKSVSKEDTTEAANLLDQLANRYRECGSRATSAARGNPILLNQTSSP